MSYSKIQVNYYGDGVNSQQAVNTRQGVVKKATITLSNKVKEYGDKYGYDSIVVDFSLDHIILKGGGSILLDKDINGSSNEYIKRIESYCWISENVESPEVSSPQETKPVYDKIPNTKEEALEFISKHHGDVFDHTGKLERTWGIDFDQYRACMEKCKISFSEDSQINHYVCEFVEACKVYAENEKADLVFTGVMCAFLILAIGIYIWCGIDGCWDFWEWVGWIFVAVLAGEAVGAIVGLIAKNIYKKSLRTTK